MGKKILSQKFFNQQTLKAAENLLGKFLVRKYRGKEIFLMITEAEAYDGFDDKASHASRGKTERNKIMFEKAGRWYVYFTYGMHWMLNIVCGPKDYPAAILIRAAVLTKGKIIYTHRDRDECIYCKKNNYENKKKQDDFKNITLDRRSSIQCNDRLLNINGPARLTKFLKINKRFNGKFADKKTGLWIEDRGIKINKSQIIKLKRIGVEYAGKTWADKPYRFLLRV